MACARFVPGSVPKPCSRKTAVGVKTTLTLETGAITSAARHALHYCGHSIKSHGF